MQWLFNLRQKSVYLPSITYSIPTSTFTTRDCDELHAILDPRLLAHMGFHSSFPRSVALASTNYYRTGVQHLKALHTVHQI
eukprot:6933228-Ditylum_brightwellii.AAC.1